MQIPEITGPDYGLRKFLESDGGKYHIALISKREADVLHIVPDRRMPPIDMDMRVAMRDGKILGVTSGWPPKRHQITRAMLHGPYGPLLIRADRTDEYFSIRIPAVLDTKDFYGAVTFPEEPKPRDMQVTYPAESFPEILTVTPDGQYLIISNRGAQVIDTHGRETWLPETPVKEAGNPVYRYGMEDGMPYLGIRRGNDVTTVSARRLSDYGKAMGFSACEDWYVAGRHFPVPLLWAPRVHLTGSYL